MSVWDRPYAGNYRPNRQKVVRYTPDAIVLLNGDTTVPGNNPEHKVVDIQKYLTQVSVDAGTEAGSASASFTLSIPRTVGSSLFSDGHSVFQPGLEVHVYMRGFFPVEKLPKMLSGPELESLKKVLGDEVENLALRPYYHCFHGITTTANLEFSGGFYSINMSCSGMLHFWQYHDISTNASLFGTRPTGSKLKMSLVGHNFTNMTPFSIIYSLYKDTAGAAGGVAFALSSNSNQSKKFFDSGSSLFEMAHLYWEKRFQSKMYNLRMFGVNGEMLNTAQTAMVGRMSTKQLNRAAEINLRHKRNLQNEAVEPLRADHDWRTTKDGVTGKEFRYRSLSHAMLNYMPRAGEKSGYAVSAAQLKAFVNDIGQWGSVNLWESNYTSKLDIASAASTAVGFEFYQDVDGDLVFKPPLYNMDTRNLNAYNINPVEIISLTRASAEPQCTYMTVKSAAFQNVKGLGLEGEWGIRGQYIDYRLVAKYGWRPGDFDAQFYSDSRGAFWAAVARMDILNEAMETANITIPLRPEIRPGFPVYVAHLDCFYYVKSLSHQFSYGGQCTTSLQCVAQRKKFLPPGDPKVFGSEVGLNPSASSQDFSAVKNGLDAVKLSRPDAPGISLVTKTKNGEFKLIGFPNVVMALDPTAVSPLVWAFGQDVTDLSNMIDVRNLVALLAGLNSSHPIAAQIEGKEVAKNLSNDTITGPLIANKATANGQNDAAFTSAKMLDGWFETGQIAGSSVDIYIAVSRVDKTKKKPVAVWKYLPLKLTDVKKQMKAWNKYLEDTVGKGKTKTESFDAVEKKKIEAAQQKFDKEMRDKVFGAGYNLDENATVFDLMTLVGDIKDWMEQADPDMLDSAKIIDLLGDKKANFNNATTPGYYRYYSSNHPEPKDQSPDAVSMSMKQGGGTQTKASDPVKTSYDGFVFKKGPLNPGTEVQSPKLRMRYIEAEKSTSPVRTFRIAGAGSSVEDKHTNEINTLSFAMFPMNLNALVPVGFSTMPQVVVGATTTKEYGLAMADYIDQKAGAFDLQSTTYDEYVRDIVKHFDSLKFPGKKLAGKKLSQELSVDKGDGLSSGYYAPPFVTTSFTAEKFREKYPAKSKWKDGVRMQIADYGADGNAATKGDMKLQGVPLGQIPRHLACAAGKKGSALPTCKCHKNKRGKVSVVTAKDRTKPLDTKKIDVKMLKSHIQYDLGKRLVRRIFYFFNLALDEWFNEYKKVMKMKNPKGDDKSKQQQGINEYAKFDEFMKDLNSLLLISYNKKIKSKGYRINVVSMTRSNKFKGKGLYSKLSNIKTPVFPISDNGGYKVFGSYAYGRGVTVGANGTLSELMQRDPLEDLDDETIDKFIRELLKRGGKAISELEQFEVGAYGKPTSGNYNEVGLIEAIMRMQNENPAAFTRIMRTLRVQDSKNKNKENTLQDLLDAKMNGQTVPTEDELKQWIGNGLINHFNRDDTPGTYTSPVNAAHSLVDIMPGKRKGADPTVGDEVLWDSMVRLAAGDSNSFIYVMPEGADGEGQSNVVKTVQQQIAEAAGSHFPIQDEYRGKKEKPRTKVDFDTITQGWGEDSVFASAVDKFGQWGRAFAGEKPDDPQLAAAFGKLEAAKMQVALNHKSVQRNPFGASLSPQEEAAQRAEDEAAYLQGNQTARQYLDPDADGGSQDEEVGSGGGTNIVIDD